MKILEQFESAKFLKFCENKKNQFNFLLQQNKNQNRFADFFSESQKKKHEIDILHKRYTNNGKGLIRFVPGGDVLTQDERLRLAVYQSTFRDSDF